MATQLLEGAPDTVLQRETASGSLWWTCIPQLDGRKVGFIGDFVAADAASAEALLTDACTRLTQEDVQLAIGPVNGSTWHSYRFVTWSSAQAPFFMEPQNPIEYPQYFLHSGFTSLAKYYSAITDDLSADELVVAALEDKMSRLGVSIRKLDVRDFERDLEQIHSLCAESFKNNFLYSPTSKSAFISQYAAVRQFVQPELVLLAEQYDQVVGFVFAIPNIADPNRQTLIVKTLARRPARRYAGLGHLLLSRVQRQAQSMGYTRAIHALMHEDNDSVALSNRYAKTIRRYELYARLLSA